MDIRDNIQRDMYLFSKKNFLYVINIFLINFKVKNYLMKLLMKKYVLFFMSHRSHTYIIIDNKSDFMLVTLIKKQYATLTREKQNQI